MDHTHGRSNGLVVPENFIRAVRESGYLSVSSALAELIDNSLQAGATVVDIRVDRDADRNLPRITIEDNGGGMDTAELAACLRFGGSSRFDARDSFGRFGMGLPLRLSVRRDESRSPHGGQNPPRSPSRSTSTPSRPVTRGSRPAPGVAGASSSGCRVVWYDCDRIEYQRLAWLERALHKGLGRMFRRFLTGAFTLRINGSIVEASDPTMRSTTLHGHTARLAFEPLQYEIATATGSTSQVTVTFSMLPVAQWHNLDTHTKRRRGIVGGGGISILRAGREIANGWHLMGGKRKENYDDWWRCEIEFHPALDEHFGITVNKQGIRPTATLREALEPELESIARILNARVRQAFEEVKFEAAVQGSCRIAGAADADLPVIRSRGRAQGALSYRLGVNQLTGDSMFDLTLRQRLLDVTMNTDHPGYTALYRPLQEMGDAAAPVRTALDLLLLSFARSIAAAGSHEDDYRSLLQEWGTTYGRMLEKS